MSSNPLLDLLTGNMQQNNANPSAYDQHEQDRNKLARPFDSSQNKYFPPQALNPDGSLRTGGNVRESDDGKEAWVNVPDIVLRMLAEE